MGIKYLLWLNKFYKHYTFLKRIKIIYQTYRLAIDLNKCFSMDLQGTVKKMREIYMGIQEKPILFNTFSVKAILEGKKTETRRLNGLKTINENPDDWHLMDLSLNPELMNLKTGREYIKKGLIATFEWDGYGEIYQNIKCPYFVGQKLWVRETWYEFNEMPYYKAEERYKEEDVHNWKWKSSIFMPKKYARIWLEAIEVRVEKINQISDNDVILEGFKTREDFYKIIIKLNKAKNPEEFLNKWCWVIQFKRICND